MKEEFYYKMTFGRVNALYMTIVHAALAIASYPRLPIEVFIRRNFGERYFTFASCITMAFVMAYLPTVIVDSHYENISWDQAIWRNPLWYAFIVVFLWFAYKRHRESRRQPGVWDFAKFSLSSGEMNEKYLRFMIKNRNVSEKMKETVYEPLPFFIGGIVLIWMKQPLGFLLTLCAIIYSLSYLGQYFWGEHFIMDRIDQMLVNEELEAVLVDGKGKSETKGFKLYGRLPKDKDFRRKIKDELMDDKDNDKDNDEDEDGFAPVS